MRVVDRQKISKRSWDESKKMRKIAGPVIITFLAQYSIGFITAAFVGHLGEVELAAVSIVQNLKGMGSALETLCGQAVGAGEFGKLGIYLQRSLLLNIITAVFITPVYIFTSPLLKLFHQSKSISELAGKYTRWVIPQLYAYALNFPVQKFLQAQSKIWGMTLISLVALAFHLFLNWALVTKLGLGLLGAASAGNITWWLIVLAQIVYVVSGFFPEAWTGFSLSAFKSLGDFVKLSFASGIMQCLEFWYYNIVILMVGWLKNPKLAVDAFSICMNLEDWILMLAAGFAASVSVRVSNELGAGRPDAAKFSIAVVATSILPTIFFSIAFVTNSYLSKIFSENLEVLKETSKLKYFLAASVLVNSFQPLLYGWQVSVVVMNIGCYYLFGLPFGALLSYKFKLGVWGIWSGMLSGSLLQTLILTFNVLSANWDKETLQAEKRLRRNPTSPMPST